MATTSILTKLGAIAAAAVAPAALFLGAGNAQAAQGSWVSAAVNSAPGGVDVRVFSNGDPRPGGLCTYTSIVQGSQWGKPLPVFNVPFHLQEGGSARLWFPSYPTGSNWDIWVRCPDTGSHYTTVVW